MIRSQYGLMQCSIAFMVIGKLFFTNGSVFILDSDWAFTWALLIITGITYPVYKIKIERFLSSFAALLSILMNILSDNDAIDLLIGGGLLLNGFFLFQFVGAAILLTHGKIQRDYIPLCYAFVCSLCISVLILSLPISEGLTEVYYYDRLGDTFINIVLTGGLIALFGWVAGGVKKLKSEPLAMASIGAVLLGLLSAPGMLLAIGLMVIGYAKHEKPLIILGILLMPIFLFFYYYNLDISLMQKSGILTGSGIVLLAGRWYLKHRRWDTGSILCE